MKYRNMESLGWKVSALGFGCMRLPTIKDGEKETINEEKAIKLIRYGIDNEINYIDTAWPYHGGESEKIVGKALKDGYRDKVKLVSKLPIWEVNKTEDFDIFLQKQLDKLQTDYLDIYLFHALNKNRFNKLKELNLINKIEAAKKKGLVKHIGFSFHDSFDVFKEIVDYYKWDAVQIQYNYMDINYQATQKGLKYAAQKKIAVIVMEPVKGGKLAFSGSKLDNIKKKIKLERNPVDYALQFIWDQPEVSVVLSGMGSMQMVKENIESANNSGINSLSNDEHQTIDSLRKILSKNIIIPCTNCNYCIPCPEGVGIPSNFTMLNDLGWSEENRKLLLNFYGNLAKNTVELEKSPNRGNASLCVECGVCLEKCPQHIDIPNELKKVVEVFEKGKLISDL